MEAIEIALSCGQRPDEYQREFLVDAMGLVGERWAAFECGLNLPRQNGKGATAEPRVLWQASLPKQLVLWSSQQQDTSTEALYRLVGLLEETDDPRLAVSKVTFANGKEGIWFANGSRIRFMTRSKSRARGFSGDLIIFDEAMFLAEYSVGAMLPTLSARSNPQVWYMGSAVDQQIHDQGVVWARVRERGIDGGPRLVYHEFSLEANTPADLSGAEMADPELWARVNPALDVRISREYVESEFRALDSRSFAVERLGVGDWPRTDFVSSSPIAPEAWAACCDETSVLEDPVVLAYDLSPERVGSIVAAGRNQRGELHVEVVNRRQGIGWIVPRLLELQESHDVARIVRAIHGPVASLSEQEEEAGLRPDLLDVNEHGAACVLFVDAVEEGQVKHLGSSELADAVRGAATRPLGDSWAWSRKNSGIDIAPLVAATLALSAAMGEQGGEIVVF